MSFFDATRQTFSQLAQLPGIGSVYNVKNPHLVGLRKWGVRGFEKHLIFYLEGDEYIERSESIFDTTCLYCFACKSNKSFSAVLAILNV